MSCAHDGAQKGVAVDVLPAGVGAGQNGALRRVRVLVRHEQRHWEVGAHVAGRHGILSAALGHLLDLVGQARVHLLGDAQHRLPEILAAEQPLQQLVVHVAELWKLCRLSEGVYDVGDAGPARRILPRTVR